jgi:F-type H+-transporting ATPase subunit b
MLELNKWFFVLVINFLALLYVLNIILFKPLLKVFKEREDAVDGSLRAAKEMDEEKEALMAQLQKDFSGAAVSAKAKFEELKQVGIQNQKEALDKTGKEAADILEKARGQIKAEADKARESLKSDVEKFSEEIVKKLVGA